MAGNNSAGAATLCGRGKICETLAEVVEAIRSGESRVLVLRGEPGIGKTALLKYAIEIGSDVRIERAAGVELESEIPFAGLHRLCAPMLDRSELLPAPQRDALRVVFGQGDSGEPSRLLVGLAVLGLLTKVAGEQPLLCVIDDAHWLDRASAQVLGFVARRLEAKPVALLLAARESAEMREFSGLEELSIDRLGEADARELLASVVRVPLDEGVRDRLVAESCGNPMALIELPHELSPVELAGGLGLTGRMPLSGGIADNDRRRIEGLPAETRRLLLVAAADPLGDPVLLWRAARLLGIGERAAAPAEAAELVELDQRVSFRPPLVRSAVYREASWRERHGVHRVLAKVTDPKVDPDRHAWHRGQAASPPNEGVADELVLCAGRAQDRGGLGEAAAFLKRAAALTRDPALRAGRALAAAEAMHDTGAPGAALELLAGADLRPLDELQRAKLHRRRALIAFDQRRGADAFPLLRRAARMLAPLDPELSRMTYLDALGAAAYAGRLREVHGLVAAAEEARSAAPAVRARAVDSLLEGLASRIIEGQAAGTPELRRTLSRFDGENGAAAAGAARFLMLACGGVDFLWDGEVCDALARRQVQRARGEGALSVLPFALTFLAAALVMRGEFAAAAARIEEADAIAASSGIAPLPHASLLLAAWRGRGDDAVRLFTDCAADATERGEGLLTTVVDYATAVLHNGLGQYPAALAAASRASEHEDLSFFSWALPEVVEAATRSGEPRRAAAALERLSERARAGGTELGLAMEARSRALLCEGGGAEPLYREAIDRFGRSRVAVHLGRGRLVYGEWLRREGRRIDAREELRAAQRMFVPMGAEAFAARAERELAATVETARTRTNEHRDDLTAQEEEVARLARDRFSNPEIGTRLFISPRTVEYHLHKVFLKLGVRSRHELAGALPPRRRVRADQRQPEPGSA
jgi:DNA-binding CsgD family transcriptional regulator